MNNYYKNKYIKYKLMIGAGKIPINTIKIDTTTIKYEYRLNLHV